MTWFVYGAATCACCVVLRIVANIATNSFIDVERHKPNRSKNTTKATINNYNKQNRYILLMMNQLSKLQVSGCSIFTGF